MVRLGLEHRTDGRRVACEEGDYDNPAANVYNHPSDIVGVNPLTGESIPIGRYPGRPDDRHLSYREEGFIPVSEIAESDVFGPNNEIIAHRGGEIPLDPDLYRLIGLEDAEHGQSDEGQAASEEHSRFRRRMGIQNYRDVGHDIHYAEPSLSSEDAGHDDRRTAAKREEHLERLRQDGRTTRRQTRNGGR